MATIQLEIELPEELLGLLRKSRKEMEAEVRLAVALHLFRERKVSAGKAAELAGPRYPISWSHVASVGSIGSNTLMKS